MKITEETRLKAGIYRQRVDDIIRAVAEYYGVSETEMKSMSHAASKYRMPVHYFIQETIKGITLSAIGAMTRIKPMDHSAVHHSINQYRVMINLQRRDGSYIYPAARQEMEAIRDCIQNNKLGDQIARQTGFNITNYGW